MDLNRLCEFERVAELGSLSAAARELSLSVATLSARMKSFEKALGAPLFDREGRSVILTDQGRCLLANAGDILDRYRDIAGDLRILSDHQYSRLTIAIDNPFPVYLGRMMDHLVVSNPEIELRMIGTEGLNIRESLEKGTVDVCFLTTVEEALPEGVVRLRISGPAQNVILPAEHRLSNRNGIQLADLEGECFLLYPRGRSSFAREFQTRNLDAAGIRHTRYDLGTDQYLIQFLVPMGKGVLITPYHLVDLPNAIEVPLTDVPCPAFPFLLHAENPLNGDAEHFVRDYFDFARKQSGGNTQQENAI